MREIKRRIVAGLIFSKDEKLFQGQKDLKNGGVYSDCWHIPGGGVENGETDKSAIIREIKEETGIDISGYEIELVDDEGKGESEKILKDSGEKVLCKMDFIVYKVLINDKLAKDINVSLGDDLKEFAWREIGELKNYQLTPPSKELFKKLGYI